jgi:hypothetical protein
MEHKPDRILQLLPNNGWKTVFYTIVDGNIQLFTIDFPFWMMVEKYREYITGRGYQKLEYPEQKIVPSDMYGEYDDGIFDGCTGVGSENFLGFLAPNEDKTTYHREAEIKESKKIRGSDKKSGN